MHLVDQGLQTVRKFCGIYIPVAQSRMIVGSLSKPAIVYDEAFHADAGGFFGKSLLASLIDVKSGSFPGVIKYGPQPGMRIARQDSVEFESMQQARGSTDAVVRVARIEVGRLQAFTRCKVIAEVKTVRAASHAHLLNLILLDIDLPGATPAESAEP